MDWTGGVRRRFAAGKNNAVLQKQKSHFARARAISQNPRSSQHSFKPNFLQDRPCPDESTQQRNERRERGHRSRVKPEHALLRPRVQRDSNRSLSKHSGHTNNGKLCHGVSEKQRVQQHTPSVIYISSGDHSSTAEFPPSHRNTERKESSYRPSPAHTTGTNDEERLLLAKRRKLLARTDWLGLAALRPIRIKFPSTGDKDRIGKRRKIQSSASRKGKPAEQRLLPLLFERPFSQNEHMMSGAFQRDDIQIKIGTDALVSQTQRSRHSQTPGRTSVRRISSEFGPLSEESMLLGPEGDDFESVLLPDPAPHPAEATKHDTRSLATLAGSQMTQHLRHVPDRPEMVSFRPEEEEDLEHEYVQQTPSHAFETNSIELVPESEYLQKTNVVPHLHMDHNEPPWPLHDFLRQNQATSGRDWNLVRPTSTQKQAEEHVDDDDAWKRLFKIDQMSSGHHSLKSSSMHDTTSDSTDCRFILEHAAEPQYKTQTDASIPKNGNQVSMLVNASGTAIEGTSERPSTNLQSPSTSFKRIAKLADHPSAPAHQIEEDAKDEALWRQFIVGSQDSSDDISQHRHESPSREGRDTVIPAHASPAFTVSGLGTSVRSTMGDSLFVHTGSSSAMSDTLSKRHKDSSFRPHQNTSQMQASSGARQTADLDEEDSIEDVQPPADRARQVNNAATTSILTPKRFEHPAKKESAPERKPSRFRRSRRTTTAANAGQSVYDLVDSDGISLA